MGPLGIDKLWVAYAATFAEDGTGAPPDPLGEEPEEEAPIEQPAPVRDPRYSDPSVEERGVVPADLTGDSLELPSSTSPPPLQPTEPEDKSVSGWLFEDDMIRTAVIDRVHSFLDFDTLRFGLDYAPLDKRYTVDQNAGIITGMRSRWGRLSSRASAFVNYGVSEPVRFIKDWSTLKLDSGIEYRDYVGLFDQNMDVEAKADFDFNQILWAYLPNGYADRDVIQESWQFGVREKFKAAFLYRDSEVSGYDFPNGLSGGISLELAPYISRSGYFSAALALGADVNLMSYASESVDSDSVFVDWDAYAGLDIETSILEHLEWRLPTLFIGARLYKGERDLPFGSYDDYLGLVVPGRYSVDKEGWKVLGSLKFHSYIPDLGVEHSEFSYGKNQVRSTRAGLKVGNFRAYGVLEGFYKNESGSVEGYEFSADSFGASYESADFNLVPHYLSVRLRAAVGHGDWADEMGLIDDIPVLHYAGDYIKLGLTFLWNT